jgi:hypothetical protein
MGQPGVEPACAAVQVFAELTSRFDPGRATASNDNTFRSRESPAEDLPASAEENFVAIEAKER